MTFEELGHNREIYIEVTINNMGFTIGRHKGLLVLSGRHWYMLSNDHSFNGGYCDEVEGSGYDYSWILGRYNTSQCQGFKITTRIPMEIRKRMRKHKMI